MFNQRGFIFSIPDDKAKKEQEMTIYVGDFKGNPIEALQAMDQLIEQGVLRMEDTGRGQGYIIVNGKRHPYGGPGGDITIPWMLEICGINLQDQSNEAKPAVKNQ